MIGASGYTMSFS